MVFEILIVILVCSRVVHTGVALTDHVIHAKVLLCKVGKPLAPAVLHYFEFVWQGVACKIC